MMIRVRTCQSGIKFVSEMDWHCSYKGKGNTVKRTLIIAAVLLSTVLVALPALASQIDDYIDGPWMKFLFPQGAGQDATGSCNNCYPDLTAPTVDLESPSWDFSLAGMAEFRITDAFLRGDSFEVYDGGILKLTTPSVAQNVSCGSDPAICYGLADVSWGLFTLGSGSHSLTIKTAASPYTGGGAAFFRIARIISTPEPLSLMLLGLGLLGLGAIKRSRG
jgi:hypothetical protein